MYIQCCKVCVGASEHPHVPELNRVLLRLVFDNETPFKLRHKTKTTYAS